MKQEGRKKLFPPPRRDAGVAFIFESALGGSRSSKRRTKSRRPDEPDGHGRKAEHGLPTKFGPWPLLHPATFSTVTSTLPWLSTPLMETCGNPTTISAILGDPGIRGIRACDLAISANQEIASALGKYPTPVIAGVSVLVRRGRKWHAEQPNRHTGWTVQANCDHYYGVK